jgi:hypothetical protein
MTEEKEEVLGEARQREPMDQLDWPILPVAPN